MKKIIFTIFLLIFINSIAFAQIPVNWDINPPGDTLQFKYAVGISQPSISEQDALKGAWQNAVQQIASSITTRFQGQIDINVQSQSYSSSIEDVFTVYMETSSFSTNVPITGVKEQARKIERENGRIVARALLSIPIKDYEKAKQYVENEEAAFLAYRFFGQKNLFQVIQNQKPSSFEDYYSWLRNNCVIISINEVNSNALLEQLDILINKLYRNAVVFAHVIDSKSARIIYNQERYYDGILRTLQNTLLFTIQREGTHLQIKPVRLNILNDFKEAVSAIKDSGRYVITGLETIQTQSGESVNQNSIVINQFKVIVSGQYKMQAVNYNIPSFYISGSIDDDGIIKHIQNKIVSFPARYLIICRSQTSLETGIPEYNKAPLISASCNFTLYDIVTGEVLQSETVKTPAGTFTPVNLEDRTVINEGRRALRFLYDPRTQPGLEEIIKKAFERL